MTFQAMTGDGSTGARMALPVQFAEEKLEIVELCSGRVKGRAPCRTMDISHTPIVWPAIAARPVPSSRQNRYSR